MTTTKPRTEAHLEIIHRAMSTMRTPIKALAKDLEHYCGSHYEIEDILQRHLKNAINELIENL